MGRGNQVTGDDEVTFNNNALVAQIVARIGSEIGLLFQFGSGHKSGQLYNWSVANIDTCSAPNKHFGPRVFFSVWRVVRLPQDGERGERLTDTLSGAKHGGHHHQERALALTSLRRQILRQIRCCALATTITWFYELIDRKLAAETVAQAQRRIVRRKLVNADVRSR